MNKIKKQSNKVPSAEFFRIYARYLAGILEALDFSALKKVADLIIRQARKGKTVYIIGNGGSASTASHFATDLMHSSLLGDKYIIRAFSLAENPALMTAISNDVGYERVFSKQLEKVAVKGDILIAISASGNSPNLLNAFGTAKKIGVHTVALVGFDGGKMAKIADYVLHAKTEKSEYGPAEDAHLFIDHMISSYIAATFSRKNLR